MSYQHSSKIIGFGKIDPVFARVRKEAEEAVRREPEVAGFILATVLNHDTLESAIIHRIAERLDAQEVPAELIRQSYLDLVERDPVWARPCEPTCSPWPIATLPAPGLSSPCCTSKASTPCRPIGSRMPCGKRGARISPCTCKALPHAVSVRHPSAARIGQGIFLDHATGLVVGSTAEIGDNVSMLHSVTLGGTGKEDGDRHPKIRAGVLIGAGAKIIGNIEVGHCARVAAGSVVLHPVPHNKTVAGVPARVVGEAGCAEPARSMDQLIAEKLEG